MPPQCAPQSPRTGRRTALARALTTVVVTKVALIALVLAGVLVATPATVGAAGTADPMAAAAGLQAVPAPIAARGASTSSSRITAPPQGLGATPNGSDTAPRPPLSRTPPTTAGGRDDGPGGPPAAAPASLAMATGETRRDAPSALARRLEQWPAWRLPAPLERPGRQPPRWPAWFAGDWLVESAAVSDTPAGGQPSPSPWQARFRADGRGGAVADRAFNALSLGRSLLGDALLSVQDDPSNPQRQLTRLRDARFLETTLIGQRSETAGPELFLNDELSLQVLHGSGEPRVKRVEVLGRWRHLDDGSIVAEQWQAVYASPSEGLTVPALSTERFRLRLVPVPPGSDRAS